MRPSAEFIYTPTSGDYSERHFEVPGKEFRNASWNWVLFTKSNGTKWVASFRGGDTETKGHAHIMDTSLFLIVSDGQGYLIDVDSEALVRHTKEDSIRQLATSIDNSVIILADFSNIFIIDKSLKTIYLQPPILFDYVWFKDFEGSKLKIEYEEQITGDLKVIYLDTSQLEFSTN
jgi:hypothetical protein